MFGEREFALMKQTAFSSTPRVGRLVDELAMLAALARGPDRRSRARRLLDGAPVGEPAPPEELFKLDNVILTRTSAVRRGSRATRWRCSPAET